MSLPNTEAYFKDKLASLNWEEITKSMNDNGYVVIKKLLTGEQCDAAIQNYHNPNLYRKTVNMKRYRFGLGEYKYYNYPLPRLIEQLRTQIFPYLAPIANKWFKTLKIDVQFPETHKEFLKKCHENGQEKATALILQYSAGGFNTLHQDLYGEIYFPIQLVMFLNQAGKDYTGGQFVLTQQIPRAQSKAIVLQPDQGDVLIFSTNFKPEQGVRGPYRVSMKHGVSEVHSGERYTLGVIFHDATS